MKFNEEWAYSQILERTEEALTFYENSEDEFKKEKIANLNRVKNNVIVLFLLSNEKCYFKNIETNGKLMPFVFIAPENTEYSINIATLKNCLGTNALDIISKNIDTEKSEITFDEVKSFYETLNKKGKVKEDNTSAAQPSKKKLKNLSKIDKEQLEEDTLSNISDIYSDLSQEKAKYPLVQKQDKQDVSDLMPVFDDDVSDEETEENNDADGKDFDVSLDSMDDFDDYFSNVKPVSNKKSKNASRKSKNKLDKDTTESVAMLQNITQQINNVSVESEIVLNNTHDNSTENKNNDKILNKNTVEEEKNVVNNEKQETAEDVPSPQDAKIIDDKISSILSAIGEDEENLMENIDVSNTIEDVIIEENKEEPVPVANADVLDEKNIDAPKPPQENEESFFKNPNNSIINVNNDEAADNSSNETDIDEEDDDDEDDEITEEDIKKMLAEIKAEYEEAAAKEQEEQEAKAKEVLDSLSSQQPQRADPKDVPKSYIRTEENKDVKMFVPESSQPVKNINELICDIYKIKAYDPIDPEKPVQERYLHDITVYVFPLSVPENGNEILGELATYVVEDDQAGCFSSDFQRPGSVKVSTNNFSFIFQVRWTEGEFSTKFYQGIHKDDVISADKVEIRPSDIKKVGFGHPYLTLTNEITESDEPVKIHALYIPKENFESETNEDGEMVESTEFYTDENDNIKTVFILDNNEDKTRAILQPKHDNYEIAFGINSLVCFLNCKKEDDNIVFNFIKKDRTKNVGNAKQSK